MRHKDFSLLSTALGVSTYANHFGSFLLSWMVYDLTGSKLAMGTLWLSIIIGQMLAQFLIGPYLDRWRRKNVMIVSEMLRLVIFIVLLVFMLLGSESVLLIYAGAFLISIAFFEPAANALIPSIVDENQLIPENARATSIIQMTRIAGVLSAGLVALLGVTLSVSLVIILLVTSMMFIIMINEDGRRINHRTSWMTQFKKGSVIYLQKPVLIYLGIFMAVSNFSIFAAQAMYLPFAMENLNGDAWTYGIFAASWPVGYIIGALILGRLPDFELSARIKIMIAALVLGTLTFILLAFSGNIYTAVVVEIAAGISGPFWNVYSTHLYQVTVPEDIRAQVFSFRILIARVFAPVGILFGTFVSAAFGIEIMLMIVGALSCTVILLVYFIFMRGRKEKLLGRSSIGS